MPISDYVDITIGNKSVDLNSVEDLPLVISYKLEDKEDFSKKKGSNALSIEFPATAQNSQVANTYYNPSIEDLTTGKLFRGTRAATIRFMGQELLVGKAFLKSAKHKLIPTSFEYDFYGNSADWMIDLKTVTFYDLLKQIQIPFTKAQIIASWQYDGTNEALPYVFAPIRYGQLLETAVNPDTGIDVEDYNMRPDYMKPSLSKYWILYWAFKFLGYQLKSDFLDTSYFRRQVMPWTWGSFLDSDGTRLDLLKFLAKSTEPFFTASNYGTGFIDTQASNDSINGAYDNSDTYHYRNNIELEWTYPTDPTLNFGSLDATFHMNLYIEANARNGATVRAWVFWYKNGVYIRDARVLSLVVPITQQGNHNATGYFEDWETQRVVPGDKISAKIQIQQEHGLVGSASIRIEVSEFQIDYFRISMGGTVDFANIFALKNFNVLDYIGGVIDEFDISVQTDSAAKVVYMEPTHPYALGDDLSAPAGGYFNGKTLDWSDKQDFTEDSMIEDFTDSERELVFKYKDDTNDGTLKKVQDRDKVVIGQAKYVFPDRFAVGQKVVENRFFASTMHYEVVQWKRGLVPAPQMIIMAPENISNLSKGEAQNTFLPKSVYYKGLNSAYHWVFDGEHTYAYPEMFAVNYKPGGQNDPILSYSDESINGVTGKGLLRRFYLQRLMIMRNGQWYTTYFNLNNRDVGNILHREFIIAKGQRWELIQLDYKPLKNEATLCLLKKWTPIIQ